MFLLLLLLLSETLVEDVGHCITTDDGRPALTHQPPCSAVSQIICKTTYHEGYEATYF